MDAAESLIAERGIRNVSIKEIIKAASQKNESALQYHFGSLEGLITSIHTRRADETQAKRAEMLAELLSGDEIPSLRDLCRIMVMPNFILAKSCPAYRQYLAIFSHEVAVASESALVTVSRMGGGGESGHKIGHLLRDALPHLDEETYRQRMEIAVRTGSALMGYHARQKHTFRGKSADFFVNNLIDAMEGLLNAPVSDATRALDS
jgi:AcrR family transcriptional regulator